MNAARTPAKRRVKERGAAAAASMATRKKQASARVKRELGKRLSPGDRRAQILAVAETLFADQAYDQIGMADVSSAAGITQGLVYHYFESKEALFTAALEASTTELLRRCLPDPTLPVPRQFELGIKGYLDFVEAHRVAYLNIFHGPAVYQPSLARIVERTRQAIIDHMVDVLGLTQRAVVVTRLSLRGYIGYVEYVILDWLEHGRVCRAALERSIFAIVITALRCGFDADEDIPLTPRQKAEFERNYRRHFGLP